MSQSVSVQTRENSANRRQYERTNLSVAGRLMLPSGGEFPCDVEDISEGGIALHSQADGEIGDRVIVYLDRLGRFEGNLVRRFAGGFAIETRLQTNQRARLIERIELLKNHADGEEIAHLPQRALRRAPTSEEANDGARLTIDNGEEIACKILDISLTGAHIRLKNRPKIGTHVTVGRTLGRVVRHTDEGIGVEFLPTGKLAS
ncbi:PilZ domain-containing protein [Parvibaculaceae bacterium PLY_AMNH_Bact1]|nr:PilZ domain-containing protein [Parvibaculaceae bacterium PLY_AMNH_Bact1]